MALIVIVLFTLTFAALEVFLSGDESLSALEAAMAISGLQNQDPRNENVSGSDCRALRVEYRPCS